MMENGSFFEYLRKVIKRKKIACAIGCAAAALLCFVCSAGVIFSSDAGVEWSMGVGGRNSDLQLPVPGWLIALVFVCLGFWLISRAVALYKEAKNPGEFNLFMNVLERQFGNIDVIDKSLANTDKCAYTNAELRCNETYTFFMQYGVIKLFKTESICGVRTGMTKTQSITGNEYYVVAFNVNRDNNIKIITNKKKETLVAKYISDACRNAQK